MPKFNAVLTDECGDWFSVTVHAESYDEAWDVLAEEYPESNASQVSRQRDIGEHERRLNRQHYAAMAAEYD